MWTYRAQALGVHDGDTVTLLVDTGFMQRAEVNVRLVHVSAPELSQVGGVECRDFTSTWVEAAVRHATELGLRWPLRVTTVTTTLSAEPVERRSFTRYVGRVWASADVLSTDPKIEPVSLNEALLAFVGQHPEWGTGTLAGPLG